MNDLVSLIIFFLSCYGGSNGIVYSRLLQPIRLWIIYSSWKMNDQDQLTLAVPRTSAFAKFMGKLIQCPLCVGFWLGIIYSLGIYSPCANTMWYPWSFNFVALVFDGFLGSASAWIMHLIFLKRMEGTA